VKRAKLVIDQAVEKKKEFRRDEGTRVLHVRRRKETGAMLQRKTKCTQIYLSP